MTSTCWQISFFPKNEPDKLFLEFLDSYFEVTAQNYSDDGQDEYVGYQSGKFNEEEMIAASLQMSVTLPEYKISKLTSENWLKDYTIKFDSFEIADFCIYGIHQNIPPQTNKILLQIYAATAFGSNHQTTQCCINAISELYHQNFLPDNILDIGTGSGILSLCAGKLWPNSKIFAGDIDEESVVVTQNNAATNNLSEQITALHSDGYRNTHINSHSPYQLILSNILANPLMEFAPDLSSHLANGGYCILSGFIENQVSDVISAHEKQGLKLIKLYSHDNWRAALMQKE